MKRSPVGGKAAPYSLYLLFYLQAGQVTHIEQGWTQQIKLSCTLGRKCFAQLSPKEVKHDEVYYTLHGYTLATGNNAGEGKERAGRGTGRRAR